MKCKLRGCSYIEVSVVVWSVKEEGCQLMNKILKKRVEASK